MDWAIDNIVIAGSPATVAEKLLAVREQIGPFGTIVLTGLDWDDKALWKRSMALMAKEVMPSLRAGHQRRNRRQIADNRAPRERRAQARPVADRSSKPNGVGSVRAWPLQERPVCRYRNRLEQRWEAKAHG